MKLELHAGVARSPRWRTLNGAMAAAALFCVSTFAISSFRASLNPETTFELLNAKRLALIVAGAGVFWFAIRASDRELPDLRGLVRIGLVALPGLVCLLGLAVGWDVLVDQRTDDLAARNLRWILMWSGYLGTGIAAWLAVKYASALSRAQTAMQQPDHRPPDHGFWVKAGRQTVLIAHDAVEWVEAEGNYARIHGRDSAQGLVRMTLAAIKAELDAGDFVRIHRSALCRRSAIRGYRRKPSGAMLALLASGDEAPLGRAYAKTLMEQARGHGGTAAAALDDTVSREQSEVQPG